MLFKLYSLVYFLLTPFVLIKGLLRNEGTKVFERFGFYRKEVDKDSSCIWLHAVSVGEINAIVPLVNQLRSRGENIVITTGTISGFETCKRTFNNLVTHVFFPVDLHFVIKKFFNHFKPKAVLIAETELWPNLMLFCQCNEVTISLINGRLSVRTFKIYSKLIKVVRPILMSFDKIICQNQLYAKRFKELGFRESSLSVSGNLKLEVRPSHDIGSRLEKKLDQLFYKRKIIVLGSTHSKEEHFLKEAVCSLRNKFGDLLIVHVPRYKKRVKAIKTRYLQEGLITITLDEFSDSPSDCHVLIVDRLGVLNYFYSKATVAIVGGSFEKRGCHNVIEPAFFGVPVIVGPHIENFEYEILKMERSEILSIETTAFSLKDKLSAILRESDQGIEFKKKCEAFISSEQGGLQKTLRSLGYLT
ncbi:3-deoxy-D-manno-octulosonic acid transferase [Pseudomonadota bacterium]|nr:3-deoxy-D-manno-octulosonic acid transferase [Pseudomonadota bacterium]